MELQDVSVAPVSLARFEKLATPGRWQELQDAAQTAKRLLGSLAVRRIRER